MNTGWIKLHRKLLEWEWYSDINVTRLFLHLMLKANHKDKKYRGTVIKRGQLLTGRELLSSETGLSEQQIRTCLTKLKSTSDITIKSTSKGTLLTVDKYSVYQESFSEPTSALTSTLTNEQPTDNQQVTTNKNVKKDKNVKKEIIYPDNLQDQFDLLWDAKGKKGSKKKAFEIFKALSKGQTNETAKEFTDILVKDLFENQYQAGYQDRMLTSYLNGQFWEK